MSLGELLAALWLPMLALAATSLAWLSCRDRRSAEREARSLARLGELESLALHDPFTGLPNRQLVVVTPSICDTARATALKAAVGRDDRLGRSRCPIGVSIGVAIYPRDGASAEQLLGQADARRYRGKRAGRALQARGGRIPGVRPPASVALRPGSRILGIDPGLRVSGFGVIDARGSELRYVASGCIRTRDGELPGRLKTLLDGVREVIGRYQPDQAAVEIVFVNVNPRSTLLLGQARGAVICGAVSCDLPVAEYSALQVKQAVVGYGKADKRQVQHMVQRLLGLPELPGEDAADALACAICHANGGQPYGAAPLASPRRRAGRLIGR